MVDIIHKANIRPGYQSDHSVTEIEIVVNNFKCGKGKWKFNNSLLKEKELLSMQYRMKFLNMPSQYTI